MAGLLCALLTMGGLGESFALARDGFSGGMVAERAGHSGSPWVHSSPQNASRQVSLNILGDYVGRVLPNC